MAATMSRGRGRRTISEINMVPFIDVMLVLLIIFMVTAPLIAPSVIDLPSVGKAAKQPDVVLQIIIGKDESLTLKQQDQSTPVTLQDLVRAVKSAGATMLGPTAGKAPNSGAGAGANAAAGAGAGAKALVPANNNTAVVISADKSVKYEVVVKVMDVLQRAGVQRVGLSVQLAN